VKELQLSNGGVTLLDYEEFEYFKRWDWRKTISGYVVRTQGVKTLLLHKEILKRAYDYFGEADHKNNCPWDNRKENLKPATHSQNQMNQGLRFDNTTGYKGVSYNRARRKYRARIVVGYVRIHLGYFTDILEAARAYDKAAKQYHKEFAFLNFPEAQEGNSVE